MESCTQPSSLRGRVWWPLALVIVLLFSQFWVDVAGQTIRSIDLVLIALIGLTALPHLLRARLRYYRSPLNAPMLGWMAVVLLSMVVAQVRPLAAATQSDAIVNAIRLVLGCSLFFIVAQSPVSLRRKTDTLFLTVIGFSFITAFVSLLQIGHWDGWLPVSLPAVLVTFKEGANQDQGREIFGLFLGNTGTHIWSAMLAMQALAVFVVGMTSRKAVFRVGWLAYFLLLAFILIRTSVRNSIVGLAVAVFLLALLMAWRSRYPLARLALPVAALIIALLGLTALQFVSSDQYFFERILQVVPRFSSEGLVIDRASNIYGRLEYMQVAWLIFSQYPLLGGGFYSFGDLSNMMTGLTDISHAHNSYLQTLAEMGTVGGLALAWLLLTIVYVLAVSLRHIRRQDVVAFRVWALTFAVFAFLLFTALFSNPFWDPSEMGFMALLLGILQHQTRERAQ